MPSSSTRASVARNAGRLAWMSVMTATASSLTMRLLGSCSGSGRVVDRVGEERREGGCDDVRRGGVRHVAQLGQPRDPSVRQRPRKLVADAPLPAWAGGSDQDQGRQVQLPVWREVVAECI